MLAYAKVVYHSFIPHRLLNVFVELTNVCNLRCVMCYSTNAEGVRAKGYMQKELFTKIVDELSMVKPDIVMLHYAGESLLHPDFKEFLAYARSKLPSVRLGWQDNGMLLDREVADYIIKVGVDFVGFSLDGIGKVNDEIRLGAKYEKIEHNILQLLSLRGTNKKPSVYINATKLSQPWKTMDAFIAEWIDKVDSISINPTLNAKFQVENPEEYYRKVIPKRPFCFQPFSSIGILYNGDVVACCHDANGLNVLDNVKDETIKQIWNGENYKRLRRCCLKSQFPPGSPCSECNAWKIESSYDYSRTHGLATA